MRIRPRRQPVQRRHVIAMLAVLAVITWATSALVIDVSQQSFLDNIEPIVTCLLVAATFFVPALRRACTNRGSWSALRRAQRYLRDFGLCLGLLGLLGLALMFSEIQPGSPSEGLPNIVFDMSVDAMLDGSTIYLWGLVALLILRGVVWIESKLTRGAR
ncbi:putative membrane protein [Burkholderia gladioli]|uniref:Membrane protein n=1 Tax=Burkholderia gladioli TaxID=28095 RepID=A0AAW3ET00_BURGA|nr:hypothetical protein [Burkholderia gladioli]KGC10222.1 putative membrane protein [Burkholderia gladioli]